ncbi:MAG: class I SAM-dependent methyltransferase [Ectobacillus sp.]
MAGHRFNPEKAGRLLDPKRQQIVPSEKVIEILGVEKDDVIADLGAGNGYFTVPIAKITEVPVYAIDIEPKMLDFLQEHAQREGVTDIQYITSDITQVPLDSGAVDKALIAFVAHEVPSLDDLFAEMRRMINPGGKLLILEWEAVQSEMGPPLHERIPSQKLKELLEQKGFAVELFTISEPVYGLLVSM